MGSASRDNLFLTDGPAPPVTPSKRSTPVEPFEEVRERMSALRKPAVAPAATPVTRVIRRRAADLNEAAPRVEIPEHDGSYEVDGVRLGGRRAPRPVTQAAEPVDFRSLLRGPPNNGTVAVSSARDRVGRSRGY